MIFHAKMKNKRTQILFFITQTILAEAVEYIPIFSRNKPIPSILLDPIIIFSVIAVGVAYIALGTFAMSPLTLLVFSIILGV